MGVYTLNWNGQKYNFETSGECARFAENMARVESRKRAAGDFITEEMRPSHEIQTELHWREQRELWEMQQRQLRQESGD